MSDLDRYLTVEAVEKAARALWGEPGWEQATHEQRQHHREAAARALSAVADDLRSEGAAGALHAALYCLEVIQRNHDVAECAAPVPGEAGRQDAIDEWISICEEPVEWMRKFAQRYAHEAPSDAYIREAKAEAWDEGAQTAWDRSTPEVNGQRYHWRHEGEPTNPYRKDADHDH